MPFRDLGGPAIAGVLQSFSQCADLLAPARLHGRALAGGKQYVGKFRFHRVGGQVHLARAICAGNEFLRNQGDA